MDDLLMHYHQGRAAFLQWVVGSGPQSGAQCTVLGEAGSPLKSHILSGLYFGFGRRSFHPDKPWLAYCRAIGQQGFALGAWDWLEQTVVMEKQVPHGGRDGHLFWAKDDIGVQFNDGTFRTWDLQGVARGSGQLPPFPRDTLVSRDHAVVLTWQHGRGFDLTIHPPRINSRGWQSFVTTPRHQFSNIWSVTPTEKGMVALLHNEVTDMPSHPKQYPGTEPSIALLERSADGQWVLGPNHIIEEIKSEPSALELVQATPDGWLSALRDSLNWTIHVVTARGAKVHELEADCACFSPDFKTAYVHHAGRFKVHTLTLPVKQVLAPSSPDRQEMEVDIDLG